MTRFARAALTACMHIPACLHRHTGTQEATLEHPRQPQQMAARAHLLLWLGALLAVVSARAALADEQPLAIGSAGSGGSYSRPSVTGPANVTYHGSGGGVSAAAAGGSQPAALIEYSSCMLNSARGPAWTQLAYTGRLGPNQVIVGASCAIQAYTGSSCGCLESNCGTAGKPPCCWNNRVNTNGLWAMDVNSAVTDDQGRDAWLCRWTKVGSATGRGQVAQLYIRYFVATLNF